MKNNWQLLATTILGLSLGLCHLSADEPQQGDKVKNSDEQGSNAGTAITIRATSQGKFDHEKMLKQINEALAETELSAEQKEKIIGIVKNAVSAKSSVATAVVNAAQILKDRQQDEILLKAMNGLEHRLQLERVTSLPDVVRQKILGAKKAEQTERFILGVALKSESTSLEVQEDDKTESAKIIIDKVFDDSPAAAAGIEEGDVVVSVDGKKIDDAAELIELIQTAGKKGDSVSIAVLRDSEVVNKEVKPAKQPETAVPDFGSLAFSFSPANGYILKSDGANGAWLERNADQRSIAEELAETKSQLTELHQELIEIKELLKSLKKD